MSNVWIWMKKNWKLLLFPVWLLSILLTWVYRVRFFSALGPTADTTDYHSPLEAKDKAMADFRWKLDELEKKAEDGLQRASEEQLEEYEKIKDKPLPEIAAWIDKLS